MLVRALRYLLPISALAMFASYGLFMQRSITFSWKDKKIGVDKLEISKEGLVAHNPRYSGFDKNGGEFMVRANTGEQDLKLRNVVRLKSIEGQLHDASRSRTDLKATRGTFDTGSNVLELFDKIDVVSQNGMNAELTRATVFTKENRIVSPEPVTVRMPNGVVRGQTMTIEQKRKQVLFDGGVVANLKQEGRLVAAGAEPPLRGTTGLGQPKAPVDVTSARLLIDDVAKRATFAGNVVAKQADSVMETAELEVHYEGQPGGQGQVQAGPGQNSRLSKLVATSSVVLTRGQERATGSGGEFDAQADRATLLGPVVINAGPERSATSDRAEIDNKNDAILLTGNVVVTQQKNVLKGRRLRVDRKKGTMELESPAIAGLPKGRISALLVQAENEAAAKKTAAKPAEKFTEKSGPSAILGGNLRPETGQPVNIDADRLDVDDKAKTAIFRGGVVAKQGEYTIRTEELVAAYSGESGLALGEVPVAGQAQAGLSRTPAQLQKVTAPRVVDIVAKDGQRARGNSAVFDTKANVATLSGDVRLSQGTTITTGSCARLDMNTGSMRIVDACGFSANGPAGAAAAPLRIPGAPVVGQPGQQPAPGRAQVLIYPGLLKDEQKKERAKGAVAPASVQPPHTSPQRPARGQTRDDAQPPLFGN